MVEMVRKQSTVVQRTWRGVTKIVLKRNRGSSYSSQVYGMKSANPFFGCANSPRQWNKGTNIRNSEAKRRTNFRVEILSSIYIPEWGSGCSGSAASTIDKILIINRYPVCLFHELSFQPTKKASISWLESKVGYISRMGRTKPSSDFKNQ